MPINNLPLPQDNQSVKEYDTTQTETINQILNILHPVGSVYISINPTNPSTLFGGTWAAFATGRTLVGVDTSQTEFNTVQKTGGANTQTSAAGVGTTYIVPHGTYYGLAPLSHTHTVNVLQPFITCYMWRRTA